LIENIDLRHRSNSNGSDALSENVGTDSMTALQQSLRNRSAEFAANPLLSNGGRIMNIHDPDRYGWANVRNAAERDGLVGLTMFAHDTILTRLQSMFGADADLPFWQAFTGEPDDVLPACEAVLRDVTLPTGWRVESHTNPNDDTTRHDPCIRGFEHANRRGTCSGLLPAWGSSAIDADLYL
jgi:hypothetical protein